MKPKNDIELAYKYKLPSTQFELTLLRQAIIDNKINLNNTLDVGCGVGHAVETLEKLGATGTGIDLNNDVILWLQGKNYSNNFEYINRDFAKFILPEKSFNLITMLAVLEHIKDDHSFVRRSFQLLKDGGYFIIVVPAHSKLYCRHDMNYGHFRRYDKTDIISLLQTEGFEVVRVFSYGLHLFQVINSIFMKNNSIKDKQSATKVSSFELPSWYVRWYLLLRLGLYPYNAFQSLIKNTDIGNAYFVISRKPELI